MRIVVTAGGPSLDATVHPNFGRCPVYVFVDTETMEAKAVDNPAVTAAGGAGIQGAQFVVQQGAQAVITGQVGPNAFRVLEAAGVPVYRFEGGTVRQAVEAFRQGRLPFVGGANAPEHAGLGQSRGRDRGAVSAEGFRQEEIARLKQQAADLRRQLADLLERLDQLEKGAG